MEISGVFPSRSSTEIREAAATTENLGREIAPISNLALSGLEGAAFYATRRSAWLARSQLLKGDAITLPLSASPHIGRFNAPFGSSSPGSGESGRICPPGPP